MTVLPRSIALVLVVVLVVLAGSCTRTERTKSARPAASMPEERAVGYLAREVPRWSEENGCYSCHNNGDAVRALLTARRQSFRVAPEALADTLRFLSEPERWDENAKGDPASSDKDLARIQFSSALVTASTLGFLAPPGAVERAARLVALSQAADGSWRVGLHGAVGSPATYGPFLSTRMAVGVLRYAGVADLEPHTAAAEGWLRRAHARNVVDAAALLWALVGSEDAAAAAQSERCLQLIQRAQGAEGGWGPYVDTPPEVFDTAVVLLALTAIETTPELRQRIRRGRDFLVAMQEPGGGWPETTRPAGSASYAQHISTTGWAALALLATRR